VTNDDALYGFRLRLFALAREWGNVRAACRAMGVHPSSYYRWRRQLVRFGPEILRPRERRAPKMPNQTSPMVEQRVLAFSLAHPGFGPARISAELRRPKWGGIRLSTNGVHRVLARHGLSTRAKRRRLRGTALTHEVRALRTATPAGRSPWADGPDRLLLRGAPVRDQRLGLAIHRDRRGELVLLGRVAHDPEESFGAMDLPPG